MSASMARDLRSVEFLEPEVEEDGELELNLELSIGRSSRKEPSSRLVSQKSVPDMRFSETEECERDPSLGKSGASPVIRLVDGGDLLDPQRRREFHALRRQEARKKRDEKQQKRGICRGRNGVAAPSFYGVPRRACSVDDRMAWEAQQFQCRVKDRETRENEACRSDRRRGENNDEQTLSLGPNPNFTPKSNPNPNSSPSSDPNLTPYNTHPYPVMPVQLPYHHVQYVPFANGFGFPYMMPCWAPTVSTSVADGSNPEMNVFQPLACRGFRPFTENGSLPEGGHVPEMNGEKGIGIKRVPSLTGSLGSTSSEVSDFQSGSFQGGSGSSDTRSHSSHAPVERPQPKLSPRVSNPQGQSDNSSSSHPTTQVFEPTNNTSISNSTFGSNSTHSSPRPNSNPGHCILGKSEETLSLDKPIAGIGKSKTENLPSVTEKPKSQDFLSLSQMPCVSTTGNGPNGKSITGFLYRYTKTEVSIMCVCHGKSFSPAEFVKHAGGTDISNPLRHIVVAPSF